MRARQRDEPGDRPLAPGVRPDIENTLARYAWLFDANDIDGLRDCFTTDAALEIGDERAVTGREAVIAELRRRRERYAGSGALPWHLTSTVEIVTADELSATVRSRFALTILEADGPPRLASVGSYDDELVCVEGRWRIRRRRVRQPAGR